MIRTDGTWTPRLQTSEVDAQGNGTPGTSADDTRPVVESPRAVDAHDAFPLHELIDALGESEPRPAEPTPSVAPGTADIGHPEYQGAYTVTLVMPYVGPPRVVSHTTTTDDDAMRELRRRLSIQESDPGLLTAKDALTHLATRFRRLWLEQRMGHDTDAAQYALDLEGAVLNALAQAGMIQGLYR